MFDFLQKLSFTEAVFLFLAENVFIVICVVGIGHLLHARAGLIHRRDIQAAIGTILLNTVITYIGYYLWKIRWIHFHTDFSYRILTDGLLIIFLMDALMFGFHYVVHRIRFLYRHMHAFHHTCVKPKPVDLFILHPIEVLGFGSIWLILISLYAFNMYAVAWYLSFNVFFGMTGHLSKEIFPAWFLRNRYTQWVATPTFHFIHHADEKYHFGFYLILWDRVAKTIHPDYEKIFIELRNK